MKTKITPWRASLLATISIIALGSCVAPTAKAQPKLGLFAPPNVGAPKTRVGGGVRGGLMLPNTGAPKTRVGGGVRGGLTLPQVGAPKTRVGGGVRGGSEEDTNHLMSMPVVFVLTPESTGYTVSESPTLYYYVTDDTSFEFEITVNRDERTLVQMRRCEKIKAGLHGISLGDLGIKLEEGADYEWNVAPIPRTKFFSRSAGICSSRLACWKWLISTTPPPRPRAEPNRRVKHCERRVITRRLLLTQTPSDINLNRI